MSEIILEINERLEYEAVPRVHYDGYEIKTNDQTIFVGVDNIQSCCENWGYISSLDDTKDFIGAELLNIVKVDTALKTYDIDKDTDLKSIEKESIMFVNFETSKGTFQLVCYNDHNGYYGHDAVIISKQLNDKEFI